MTTPEESEGSFHDEVGRDINDALSAAKSQNQTVREEGIRVAREVVDSGKYEDVPEVQRFLKAVTHLDPSHPSVPAVVGNLYTTAFYAKWNYE